MDLREESREMVYKHSNTISDLYEFKKDGSLFMIS